jgi:hypothetical protein
MGGIATTTGADLAIVVGLAIVVSLVDLAIMVGVVDLAVIADHL